MVPFEILNDATAIVFDYDGTIGNVPVDWSEAREAFTINFPSLIEEGKTERLDVLERKALNAGYDPKVAFFVRNGIEGTISDPHIPNQNVIAWLPKIVVPKYVISNNLTSTVTAGLKQFGILEHFVDIIGIDKSEIPKPAPDAIKLLKKEHQKTDVIVIGDSKETDGEFAKACGLRAIIL